MPSKGDIMTASGIDVTYVNAAGDTMTGDLIVQGKNPYPIGGIYFQLPGKSAPASLFVGTWTNISSQFSGVFFRAEGGNASAFGGGTQADEIRSHNHVQWTGALDDSNFTSGSGQFPPGDGPGQNNTNITTGSTGGIETRPINVTIRVWERTA